MHAERSYKRGGSHVRGIWYSAVSVLIASLLTSVAFWGGLHVSATGSRLGAAIAPVISTRLLVIGAILFLGAWLYKWAMW